MSGPGRKILVAVLLSLVVVGLVLVITKRTRIKTLTGLLIDLEHAQPNPDRYKDLRIALTGMLADEAPELKNSNVRLNYIHYAQSTPEILNAENVDFIVLSPQGTPLVQLSGRCRNQAGSIQGGTARSHPQTAQACAGCLWRPSIPCFGLRRLGGFHRSGLCGKATGTLSA